MSHQRALLIANPASHSVALRGAVLAQVARARPDLPFLWLRDFADLPDFLSAYPARAVFVEGGDGTLEAVTSALTAQGAEMPLIGVLPGGRTNLAHHVLGLRKPRPEAVAARIAELAAERPGEMAAQRLLRVSGGGLAAPRAGLLLSTGAAARAMLYSQVARETRAARGAGAVLATLARLILAPYSLRHTDGEPLLRPTPIDTDYGGARRFAGGHAFALVTPLPRLSLGLRPWWGRGAEPLAVLHAEWPIRAPRRSALRVLAGFGHEGLAARGLHGFGCARVSFAGPGPVVLDGELLPVTEDAPLTAEPTAPVLFLR